MSDHTPDAAERPLVSRRTLEIVVAFAFLVLSAIVLSDSWRLGFHWRPNEGPAPGYFPFYIAILMIGASLFNLYKAWGDRAGSSETMVTVEGFGRMSAIMVPAIVYVFAMQFVGIYVSSAIYIAGFMMFFGKFKPLVALLTGLSVAGWAFAMFEIWFLVPLPKGPLEAALGY